MKVPRISLDHWAAFVAVIDEGSFAAAAEALNKSQSSVSYAVNRINSGLPSPVLRLAGRKAVLTEEGEVLYRHANQLLKQAQQTEAVAQSMAMGFESEVTLALDALVDIGAVACALERFSREFPHTRVRVLETSLSGTTEALLERKADLVIGSQVPVGFMGTPLLEIQMIPVASVRHTLVVDGREIEEWELKSYRQVVLRDSGQRRQIDAGWLEAEQRWTVSHFSSTIKLLRSGLGFAFLPYNWVVDEIRAGELAQIRLPHGMTRKAQLYLMVADRAAAGPATRALVRTLEAEDFGKFCSPDSPRAKVAEHPVRTSPEDRD